MQDIRKDGDLSLLLRPSDIVENTQKSHNGMKKGENRNGFRLFVIQVKAGIDRF